MSCVKCCLSVRHLAVTLLQDLTDRNPANFRLPSTSKKSLPLTTVLFVRLFNIAVKVKELINYRLDIFKDLRKVVIDSQGR
jgi:hypothetical protein